MLPTLHVNGRAVGYDDTGGNGVPVILAHGFALDRSMFADQATLASSDVRIIAWDARGHGETADDGQPYTFYDVAADQLALMDALGIEEAVVGGVSQGGFAALRTALVAPERVSALLLIDTEASALAPVDAKGYGALFAALAEQGPVDEVLCPLAQQIIGDHRAAADWVEKWKQRGVPLGAPVACLMGRDDVVERLDEIRCPAFLLRGELDTSIPVERMELLREALPHRTELHVVPGAGHSPTLTHPVPTNAVLSSFLAGELAVT